MFAALPPVEVEQIANTLRLSKFTAGEVIFQEGDPGDRFSVIVEGQIEVIKALGTAEERVLSVLGPGDYLGEMSLLFTDGLRSASVRTRTPVNLLEMTRQDFESLLDRHPTFAIRILREMSTRLRNSENMTIRDLQEKNRQLTRAYQELQAAQAQLIEKEKIEQELQVARRIQESSLPKEVPVYPGWEFAAYWQPARAVSGDFYDFIALSPGKLGLIIGDVTDKGVPAALVMATTRSLIRFAALDAAVEGQVNPGEILAKVNDMLCPDIPPGMFVTCLFSVLDLASGQLIFANAGHNLPFQRTKGGLRELRARGMPLGLLPTMNYEESESTLDLGDSLLMFSDGLVEAHDSQGEMFGTPMLQRCLESHPGGLKIVEFLLGDLAEFTGPNWEQEDDLTFLSVQRAADY